MTYLLLVLYVVLTLLSPGDLVPELAPYHPMWILSAITGLAASILLFVHTERVRTRETVLMTCFFLCTVVSWPLHGWVGGALVAARTFAPHLLVFLLILLCTGTISKLRWFGGVLIAVAIYYVFQIILAFHFGINETKFIMRQSAGDAPTGEMLYRLRATGRGILQDPNDLGQLLLAALALLTPWWKKHLSMSKIFVVPVVLLLLYGIYLTQSRGTLVGLAVLTILYLKQKLGIVGPVAAVGLMALMVVVLGFGGGRDMSFSAGSDRLVLWSQALSLIRDNPIRGVGVGTIEDHMEITPHNSFLLTQAELGVFGYAMWVGLVMMCLVHVRKVLRLNPKDPEAVSYIDMARAVYLALVTFMVTCWFLSRTYSLLLYMLLGTSAALWVTARQKFPELRDLSLGRSVGYTVLSMACPLLLLYLMVRMHWA